MYGGFPGGSDGKESACSVGYWGLIPRSGRLPGEGNDYPLQYSCLEHSMDRVMHIYMFTMQIFFFFFFANGFCQLITYLGYLSLSPYIAPLSLFRVCIASYCIDGP